MSYQATVFQVMIASPSDVPKVREIAKKVILEWNEINSEHLKIILQPVGWEENSFPEMGESPQRILNKRLLENSDLLIAIFWTRIGTPTDEFISGSVEEIERHNGAGKPTMAYFSDAPKKPSSIEYDQFKKLKEYKQSQLSRGIVEMVSSTRDFKEKFRKQLALAIQKHEYFNIKKTSEIINAPNKEPSENDFISILSNEEKLAIIETSKDRNGYFGRIPYLGGITFQANGKRLNSDDSPRNTALWDETLNKLISKGLLKPVGPKGTLFAITQLGFNISDQLIESH